LSPVAPLKDYSRERRNRKYLYFQGSTNRNIPPSTTSSGSYNTLKIRLAVDTGNTNYNSSLRIRVWSQQLVDKQAVQTERALATESQMILASMVSFFAFYSPPFISRSIFLSPDNLWHLDLPPLPNQFFQTH
jgi:hypothetical protein